MQVRSLNRVPSSVFLLLVLGLAVQIFWQSLQPLPEAKAEDLPVPPSSAYLQLASLGEPITLAKALMLWLQAFDYQSGVSISFHQLDYQRTMLWLDQIIALDPKGQYPFMSASRLYGEVNIPEKKRVMLEYVYDRFLDDPQRRWPWLAHAVIVARHQLNDLPLALRYARAVSQHATGSQVPEWARQLDWVILEKMGELESAQMLIGGLLTSGRITSPKEIHFLNQRLLDLEKRLEQRE
ncbi:MAG: hypothetical protein HQL52_04450 [Magnetococcales bacterium]|nr:hypothetical protein [Magnetococcales bacterium]